MSDEEFARVWAEWDARPGDPDKAVAMENACSEQAKLLDLDTSDFRDLLVIKRKRGLSRVDALRSLR